MVLLLLLGLDVTPGRELDMSLDDQRRALDREPCLERAHGERDGDEVPRSQWFCRCAEVVPEHGKAAFATGLEVRQRVIVTQGWARQRLRSPQWDGYVEADQGEVELPDLAGADAWDGDVFENWRLGSEEGRFGVE
jgi:hypothetical protein